MLRIIALCAVTMGTVLPVLAQPTDPDCFTEGGWPRRHCDDPKWVATLNINKTRFFPGDTLSIEYQIPNHWPKRDGTCSGCIGIIKNYKQDSRSSRTIDKYYDWWSEKQSGKVSAVVGKDFEFGEERAFWEAIAWVWPIIGIHKEQRIILAWKAKPLPGVMTLAKGSRYAPGETVRVVITLPAEAEQDNLSLYIYRPGERIPGGALTMDRNPWRLENDPLRLANGDHILPAGPSRVEFAAPVGPSTYEIRLQDEQRFVRDAISFEVRAERITLDLKPNAENPTLLDGARVRRPAYVSEDHGVRVEYDRRDGERFFCEKFEHPSPPAETSADPRKDLLLPHPLAAPQFELRGGDYQATVLLEVVYLDHDLGDPIAGRAAFHRPTPEDPYPPTVHMDGREFFTVGEPIVARVAVPPEYKYYMPMTLRLFRMGRNESGRPRRAKDAEPMKIFEAQLNDNVTIPEALAPGVYELSLLASSKYLTGREIGTAMFQVFPPVGSGAVQLEGGADYVSGQAIPLSVDLPDGIEVGDPSLRLAFVYKGGFTPGCLELSEKYVSETKVNSASMTLEGPWVPGKYEARLYKLYQFNLALTYQSVAPKAQLLATAPFTVSMPYLGSALQLPDGAEYRITNPLRADDKIRVAVRLPGHWPIREEGGGQNLRIQLYRMGDVSLDGAVRYPVEISPLSFAYREETRVLSRNVDFTYTLPQIPGRYEFRLVQAGFAVLSSRGDAVLAAAPFSVINPAWSNPIDWPGLPKPPTDLRGLTNFSVEPFPNVFQEDYCPTEIPLVPATATLKFTRFTGKTFVEIQEPIKYGESFFIEAHLKEENPRPVLAVTLSCGEDREEQIPVYKVEGQPRLYRSELYFPHWPVPENQD